MTATPIAAIGALEFSQRFSRLMEDLLFLSASAHSTPTGRTYSIGGEVELRPAMREDPVSPRSALRRPPPAMDVEK